MDLKFWFRPDKQLKPDIPYARKILYDRLNEPDIASLRYHHAHRRLFFTTRKWAYRLNHNDDPFLAAYGKDLMQCRPWGGVTVLQTPNSSSNIILRFSCTRRLCPWCHLRRSLEARKQLLELSEPILGISSVSRLCPVQDARRELLELRQECRDAAKLLRPTRVYLSSTVNPDFGTGICQLFVCLWTPAQMGRPQLPVMSFVRDKDEFREDIVPITQINIDASMGLRDVFPMYLVEKQADQHLPAYLEILKNVPSWRWLT